MENKEFNVNFDFKRLTIDNSKGDFGVAYYPKKSELREDDTSWYPDPQDLSEELVCELVKEAKADLLARKQRKDSKEKILAHLKEIAEKVANSS